MAADLHRDSTKHSMVLADVTGIMAWLLVSAISLVLFGVLRIPPRALAGGAESVIGLFVLGQAATIAVVIMLRRRIHQLQGQAASAGQMAEGLAAAEAELGRQHVLAKLIAQHLPDIVYRYQVWPERQFAYVSPAVTAIVGYTPEEHYADPDLGFKLVYPSDRHLLESTFDPANDGCAIRLRWVHRDGRIIWVEQKNVMIHDAQGRIVAIEGVARDIQAQIAQDGQRELLIQALNATGDGVVITDINGMIQWVNPAFSEMTGYTREDTIGKTPRILRSGAQSSAFYQRLWQTILGGETWSGTMMNRRKDGTIYYEQQSITPLRIGGDAISHFVSIKRDVSLQQLDKDRLNRMHSELIASYDTTLQGWVRALDLRDHETEGHSWRVTELTVELARKLGFSGLKLEHIRRGAMLHDIGKLGIPDAILHKPGPLTEEEWEVMRRHPSYAGMMLAPITFLRPALDIPLCHHERWDGSGYPLGLQGKAIPYAARIFAAIDVFDALTSDRPYRRAMARSEAIAYLYDQAGKQFDPEVVEAFIALLKARTPDAHAAAAVTAEQ